MFQTLTEEQKLVRKVAREFVDKEVAPRAKLIDQTGEFPYDLWKRCVELGYPSILISKQYGGLGLGLTEFCLVLEEISRQSQTLAIILDASVTLCYLNVQYGGTEKQKKKFLPMCIAGKIGAVSATEPSGTWNYPAWKTKAVRDGDTLVINGVKLFCTNSQAADVYCLVCHVDSEPNPRMVIVEKGSPGFTFGKIEKKLGWNGSNTGTLYFDDARVPVENLLPGATETDPPGATMRGFFESCVGIGAMCVGSAAGALKRAYEYTKQRNVLGQYLIEHQSVADAIARSAMEIELCRRLVYHTAALIDAGQRPAPGAAINFLASACKIQVPEMASRVCDLAIQLHGGSGYMTDTDIHRFWRDVRACQIGEGPTSMHLAYMADSLKIHDGLI
ncbi:MAG TPA: acyl-CoA dehydrogenase family protein [Candidatus Binataceae bacterium]|nr:acyl-CoA dehydrogenase family protein [Candidatus Binataceae bacterium]